MRGRPRVLLVAGEVSGDLHAAALLREMRRRAPQIEVAGIGGEQLRAAGMEILVDTATVATMGLVETFGTIGRLVGAYRRLVRYLDEQRPDLLVLVDYPEFNLLLARQAKRRDIPVFYFIGPQVWAWRRGRIDKIRRRVDKMGVVFPFEPGLYNSSERVIAEFVGHPLLDLVRPARNRDETRGLYGLDLDRPVVAVLPGSREKEVRYLLPALGEAAALLAAEGWQAVLALAPGLDAAEVRRQTPAELAIVRGDTYSLLACADAAVVASGTATLETALLGCPMVIVYRMAPLTYFVARRLVDVPWIGMPNIILQRPVFPELIQDEVRGQAVAAAVRSLGERRDEIRAALAELRQRLGEPGAAGRAADMALALVA
jgi:lipid-A-disaccharide synthase